MRNGSKEQILHFAILKKSAGDANCSARAWGQTEPMVME